MIVGTVKKQYVFNILSVCVCFIAQVTQNANCVFSTHQYVCHVWSISPRYLINGTIFGLGGVQKKSKHISV